MQPRRCVNFCLKHVKQPVKKDVQFILNFFFAQKYIRKLLLLCTIFCRVFFFNEASINDEKRAKEKERKNERNIGRLFWAVHKNWLPTMVVLYVGRKA